MDYLKAFAISASGMEVEKTRLDVAAVNIANMHSTHRPGAAGFAPLTVVSGAGTASFSAHLDAADPAGKITGAQVVSIASTLTPPRLVFEPGHPDADAKGYVAYPGINPVTEMVTLMSASRAYEANIAAFNAAKTMMLKTLDLGGA